MEKYNIILTNIVKLIEKGLVGSKDFKKNLKDALKYEAENIAKNLDLISREEFEVQKKIIQKLKNEIKVLKNKKKKSQFKKVKKVQSFLL